jgi:hypothetical protein
MKNGGISGLAVAMVAVGGLLMYAAIKNYQLLDVARYAFSGGRGTPPVPRPPIDTGVVSGGSQGTTASLTGTAKSKNPDAPLGASSTQIPRVFQVPTPGANKPLP